MSGLDSVIARIGDIEDRLSALRSPATTGTTATPAASSTPAPTASAFAAALEAAQGAASGTPAATPTAATQGGATPAAAGGGAEVLRALQALFSASTTTGAATDPLTSIGSAGLPG